MELSLPRHGVLSRDSISASSIRNQKLPSGDANRFGVVIGAAYLAGGNQLEEIQRSLNLNYHSQTRRYCALSNVACAVFARDNPTTVRSVRKPSDLKEDELQMNSPDDPDLNYAPFD